MQKKPNKGIKLGFLTNCKYNDKKRYCNGLRNSRSLYQQVTRAGKNEKVQINILHEFKSIKYFLKNMINSKGSRWSANQKNNF